MYITVYHGYMWVRRTDITVYYGSIWVKRGDITVYYGYIWLEGWILLYIMDTIEL